MIAVTTTTTTTSATMRPVLDDLRFMCQFKSTADPGIKLSVSPWSEVDLAAALDFGVGKTLF